MRGSAPALRPDFSPLVAEDPRLGGSRVIQSSKQWLRSVVVLAIRVGAETPMWWWKGRVFGEGEASTKNQELDGESNYTLVGSYTPTTKPRNNLILA